jgi:hypothetical protein
MSRPVFTDFFPVLIPLCTVGVQRLVAMYLIEEGQEVRLFSFLLILKLWCSRQELFCLIPCFRNPSTVIDSASQTGFGSALALNLFKNTEMGPFSMYHK